MMAFLTSKRVYSCALLLFELQVLRVSQSQAAMGMIAERISKFPQPTSISKRHAQVKMLRDVLIVAASF